VSFARRRRILSCTWWASWRAAEELHRDKCGQSRSQEHSEEQPPRLHSLDMQYGGASPPQRYRYTGGFALIIFSLSRELSQCSRVGFCFIDPLSISGDFFHQPPLKCFPDLDCGEAGYGHGGYSPQLSPRMHRLRNGGGHSYGGGPSYGGEPSNGAGLVRHYPHEYSSHHAPQYSHDYAPQHLRPQDYARQHPRSNYEQHQRHHPHDSAPPHSRPHSEQHRQGGRVAGWQGGSGAGQQGGRDAGGRGGRGEGGKGGKEEGRRGEQQQRRHPHPTSEQDRQPRLDSHYYFEQVGSGVGG